MDVQVAAYVNGLIAIVWVLSVLTVSLAAGWLLFPECDPNCSQCRTKRLERAHDGQWCAQHAQPKHECRDQHRG